MPIWRQQAASRRQEFLRPGEQLLKLIFADARSDAIVSQVPNILSVDQVPVELCIQVFGSGELSSEGGDRRRMAGKREAAAEQERLRGVKHGIVGA